LLLAAVKRARGIKSGLLWNGSHLSGIYIARPLDSICGLRKETCMGFARQNPPVFSNPVALLTDQGLRMAATGVGWGCETTNNPATAIQLTVKTLLRHVQDLAGFVVKSVRGTLDCPKPRIDVELVADPHYKRRCSCCGKPGRIHDKTSQRIWHFVPLWNIAVYFHYTPHRVICPVRGAPTVESMPWSLGKSPYARTYKIFLARWARLLSWKKTAEMFNASWDAVFRSVKWIVEWGLEQRDLSGVTALGVDELHWGRGKKSANFLTLVYQIDSGSRRLLHVGVRRTEATLREGFRTLEAQHAGFLAGVKVVCSDMWKPFLKVVAAMCGNAINVLDPFHIAKHLNEAVDQVRRGEQSRLRTKEQRARAKGGRFLLLKRSTKVRGKARAKLNAVLASLGATSRAWELKESFRRFWLYRSPIWAAAYLKAWTSRAMRSRLEPMKKVARMLHSHEELLLNYFRAKRQYNSGVVEGLNNKARVSLAHGYGHRSSEILKLVLYHALGKLPEPPCSHKFC
jgi:transposase